ncbi:MAG: hypothetical protein IT422_17205 [Pirellulaceae bacterium]|nr:hypothetical protein [Pirellulaceae bacterium]
MTTYFNNCRGRRHETFYGKGAFFDLNTTGLQAKMAVGLKRGEECVVASYNNDGAVAFDWWEFSREALEPDPDDATAQVRVFYGKRTRSVRISKAKAAKTKDYKIFFNRDGNFKRPSVVK